MAIEDLLDHARACNEARDKERARCADHVREELRAVERHQLGPAAHDVLVEVLRRIESGESAG